MNYGKTLWMSENLMNNSLYKCKDSLRSILLWYYDIKNINLNFVFLNKILLLDTNIYYTGILFIKQVVSTVFIKAKINSYNFR